MAKDEIKGLISASNEVVFALARLCKVTPEDLAKEMCKQDRESLTWGARFGMAGLEAVLTKEELAKEEQVCSICHEPYEGFGNNAEPVNSGRCCDVCNDTVVIQVRLNKFKKTK